MTGSWWVLLGCLAGVAVAVAWPAPSGRRRLAAPVSRQRFQVGSLLEEGRSRLADRPRQTIAIGASALALLGWLVSGVIAGVVAAVYGALILRALARKSARSRAAARRSRSLDELAALAADLRAGLPPAAITEQDLPGASHDAEHSLPGGFHDPERAWPGGFHDAEHALPGGPPHEATADSGRRSSSSNRRPSGDRIAELTRSVWRLAERTGAPAAELVERIEADARADDRAQASAAAQSAGAQATAVLLAALPLGGIALGFGIGVNPLQILLHTTLGGLCAIGAMFLQITGLLWADRLTSSPTR